MVISNNGIYLDTKALAEIPRDVYKIIVRVYLHKRRYKEIKKVSKS